MQKLESTFKNMVLSLVIISMVAAGALAGVYILTLKNIEAQKIAKQEAAKLAVLNGHDARLGRRSDDPTTRHEGLVRHQPFASQGDVSRPRPSSCVRCAAFRGRAQRQA